MFRRRGILLEFITSLPDEIKVDILGYPLSYPTAEIELMIKDAITNSAVKLAESLPNLSVKAFIFIFILYAILKHSKSIESEIMAIAPDASKEVLRGYHRRIEQTLIGIFAVQTFTAIATFLIALPVFYLLGYSAFVSLALISAFLQFIPVVGPALLIIILAALEIYAGLPVKAVTILIFGFIIIAFLPDAYLRPKLADRTTGLPASVYLIGSAGGALTLGAIGVLAEPLIIALIIETVEQLSD